MTPHVRGILSWYGADSAGTLTNLVRLLNHGRMAGTGKLVILPVEQGFELGLARFFAPNPQHTIHSDRSFIPTHKAESCRELICST